MSHTLAAETDTHQPEGVMVDKVTLIKNKMDSNQMTVEFLVSADSPEKAYSFAMDPVLVAEGIRLTAKEGLFAAGITDRGIPVSCDATGQPSETPAGAMEQKAGQRYYYLITHKYLGGDD